MSAFADAPRAGSAEAKPALLHRKETVLDAPRAGSAEAKRLHGRGRCGLGGCTPCRQRRGKGKLLRPRLQVLVDAPRAGSAEAKSTADMGRMRLFRCTPCRQRRGKGIYRIGHGLRIVMHPVQAAPRQRRLLLIWLPPVRMHPVQAAPRQRRLR